MSKITDLGFKKVKKVMYGVTIYNMDRELKNQLFIQFVKELVDNFNPDTKKTDVKITDRELMLVYLPQLTDIEFDINNEMEILNIIDNPSDELEEIMDEIKDPIIKIMKKAGRYIQENIMDTIEITKGMTQEQKDRYFDELSKINKIDEIEYESIEPTIDELKAFREWQKNKKVGK